MRSLRVQLELASWEEEVPREPIGVSGLFNLEEVLPYWMFLVFNFLGLRYLTGETCDIGMEVLLIVDLRNYISNTFSWTVALRQGTDEKTVTK